MVENNRMHAFALKKRTRAICAGAVAILLALCEAVRHSSQEARLNKKVRAPLQCKPRRAVWKLDSWDGLYFPVGETKPKRNTIHRKVRARPQVRDGRHGSVACLPNGTMLFLHEETTPPSPGNYSAARLTFSNGLSLALRNYSAAFWKLLRASLSAYTYFQRFSLAACAE